MFRPYRAAPIAIIILAAARLAPSASSSQLQVIDTPTTTPGNRWYTTNRPPLAPQPLIQLPLGTVRPEGWLRHQLELMAGGFLGHLPELSEFCVAENSAWLSPDGKGTHGWEEVPYWLKGYVPLALLLDEGRHRKVAEQWVNGVLAGQRPDGYFGPESNRALPDLWPNMPMMHALRSWHEATGDPRVPVLLTRYLKWQASLPPGKLYPDDQPAPWQKWRGGENLDTILWLFNRTGEPWLLDLARLNHQRTSDWTGGIPSWHGVNICQDFREPAQFFPVANDTRLLEAAERNYHTVMEKYGQVPGGMFGADENAREGYGGPRQAAETCSMAEFMHSFEMLIGLTGLTRWADRCEDVAFNSLPASMTADLKGLHYLTAPNQIQLDRAPKDPMIQNGGDMFSYNPYDYRCCQHNAGLSWTSFARSLWMATQDNGVAATLYAAGRAVARVGAAGTTVTVVTTTDYPFDGQVCFLVSTEEPVEFPLWLRIPAWCTAPTLTVAGEESSPEGAAGRWLRVSRTWNDGDVVRLNLPAEPRVTVWRGNGGSVSVSAGPLTYSLKIPETWKPYDPELPKGVRLKGTKWKGYEVFPAGPWNYALALGAEPALPAGVRAERVAGKLPLQPFTPTDAPLRLKLPARRLPQWKQEANGLVGEVPASPAESAEPTETVDLIPMGCARLRISAFPVTAGP